MHEEQVLGIKMANSTLGIAFNCNILLSIKIKVIEIQQTMLSMYTPVEEYLEMGVSDLLVWTGWLQDPSHRKA
jgi:hypothetical protein